MEIGNHARLIQPEITGEIGDIEYDKGAKCLRYLLRYMNAAGEEHATWFTQPQLEEVPMQVHDAGRAAAGIGAFIAREALLNEAAHALGCYHAWGVGPHEAEREHYIWLRARMWEAEARQDWARARQLRLLLTELEEVKWEDTFENTIMTVGKNDLLDKYFAGSSYTAAWYLGLISSTSYTTGPAVGDTSASHSGWAEDQNYTQGARPTTAWSSASSGSKALSSALAYTMNASTTIKGAFMIGVATKGGTTGILYSAGLFTGGDKVCDNTTTLNVSWTGSV